MVSESEWFQRGPEMHILPRLLDSVSSISSTQPVQQLLLSRNTTKGCPIIQIHNRLFCPPVVTVHTGQPGHSVTCSLKIALRLCGQNFLAVKISPRMFGEKFLALRITPISASSSLYRSKLHLFWTSYVVVGVRSGV